MTGDSKSAPDADAPLRPATGSFVRDVFPALAWAALVFLGGALPSPPSPPDLGFPVDKLQHAVAFGVLTFLADRALRYELPTVPLRLLPWLGALASIALGGALELFQLVVPERSAELMDLAADAAGALFAALVMRRIRPRH